jgi:hypothetical protein
MERLDELTERLDEVMERLDELMARLVLPPLPPPPEMTPPDLGATIPA